MFSGYLDTVASNSSKFPQLIENKVVSTKFDEKNAAEFWIEFPRIVTLLH